MSMFSIHEIFPDFYRNFDVSCRDSDIFAAACKKGRDRRAFGADPGPFQSGSSLILIQSKITA